MKRFADLIERQLVLFSNDYGELIRSCDEAERAYDRAGRDEAEARYGEYLELVEEASDGLIELRDAYASTLDPEIAHDYETAFNREVVRRMPRFALRFEPG